MCIYIYCVDVHKYMHICMCAYTCAYYICIYVYLYVYILYAYVHTTHVCMRT